MSLRWRTVFLFVLIQLRALKFSVVMSGGNFILWFSHGVWFDTVASVEGSLVAAALVLDGNLAVLVDVNYKQLFDAKLFMARGVIGALVMTR